MYDLILTTYEIIDPLDSGNDEYLLDLFKDPEFY